MSFKPLIKQKGFYQVLNSEVEGQCKISTIIPMRVQTHRIVFAVLLSIITGFLFAIACSWSKRLTKKFFYQHCSLIHATHFWVLNDDQTYNILRKDKSKSISFMNRKLRYIYEEEIDKFRPLEYQIDNLTNNQLLSKQGIQDPFEARLMFGPCKIEIPIPSVFSYLLKELTAPFYILQYVTCVLWVLESKNNFVNPKDYAALAIIMICVSVFITTLNYLLLISSVQKLREMALHKHKVRVYRPFDARSDPQWIDSHDLVPGDIMIMEPKQVIPCDSLILSGEVMMNEASLTGETVPVAKQQLSKNDQIFSLNENTKNCVFEGTTVILTKPCEHDYVLALVIRTGFCSFKGQIFRSVLYPKPQKFTFYRQAIKFLAGLACIILAIYFLELHRFIQLDLKPLIIIFRLGDAVTWIIPPALPIFVSMCMTYSLLRLRKTHKIFGVDPQKSLVAGQVNTVCFDKTGTLTTTNIEVYGYQLVKIIENIQILSTTITQNIDKDQFVFKLFATCHSVIEVESELLGDSLDVEMFGYSGYKIQNSTNNAVKLLVISKDSSLDVLKINEFESQLQRMSVLVRSNHDSKYYIFCKGSPEKIHDLSVQLSIPHNFKSQFDAITMRGLRVLGMAYKEVSAEDVQALLRGDRMAMEHDLQFMGLLIMENKLKHDTVTVMNDLIQSGLDLKVISGDNALTTIQCARECNIIGQNQPMLLVDYSEKSKQLILEEVDQSFAQENGRKSSISLSEDTESSRKNSSHSDIMKKLIKHLLKSDSTIKQTHLQKSLGIVKSLNQVNDFTKFTENYGFAITGKAFDFFWSLSPQSSYGVSKNNFPGFDEPLDTVTELDDQYRMVFTAIVAQSKIFARMRPEQKSQIVEQLQLQGRTVVMIGDGANDCAAIKQANVGISFAQSDASYAAPFSTQGLSISCVKHILLDGRAALTNTIEVFQYYIVASVIKYMAAMLMAIQGQNFSTSQMVYVNYVATIPFLGAICLSKPCDKLSNKIPLEDMVKLPNQVTIYFHIIMSGLGLILNYQYWRMQQWSSLIDRTPDGIYIQEGEVQTTLFLCCAIYFQANLLSIYISKPFKKQIYLNKIITPWWILTIAINLYFFLDYSNWMQSFLQLYDLQSHDSYMKTQLLISVVISTVMIMVQEFVIKRFLPCYQHVMTSKNQ